MDTIYAVSSGRLPAAIAVLRVSGPLAIAAAEGLAGTLPPPRQAALRTLRDAAGAVLDRALVLAFPGPASATGEDLIELHCHGGRAVVTLVERALAAAGLRQADPGEFTRRALLNGRIDLTQAEGLADLLSAETERQHRAAIDAAEGRLSRLIGGWMDEVAALSARCEALIDYGDDDDVVHGGDYADGLAEAMRELGQCIAEAIDVPPVERLRDGVRVVLAGPPNSGKSTLLNALSGRDAAIVTPIAGTTRDRIEVPVARGGIPYVLIDTAGLTSTDDTVEAIGIDRAEAAMRAADLILWLGDDPPPVPSIWVHSRADLEERRITPAGRDIAIAASDPVAIERLWAAVGQRAEEKVPPVDAIPLSRHQLAVCTSVARTLVMPSRDVLIVAEHLRIARTSLASLLGVGEMDALLDALFTRFCLGK